MDRGCTSDVQMDANHEHPAGSGLRQRQIPETGDRNSQYKITPAQQWQAGDSIWSRPAIRVFATYAKWDEKWGYAKNGNGDATRYAISDSTGNGRFSTSRGDDDEFSFGAQMEIWW